MTTILDYNNINLEVGLRWVGPYSSAEAGNYHNGDIAFKDGQAMRYSTTTKSWSVFAPSQRDAHVKASILGYDTNVSGSTVRNYLQATSSGINWANPDRDRTGRPKTTKALPQNTGGYFTNDEDLRWGTDYRSYADGGFFLMDDGTVRCMGHTGGGRLGVGENNNISRMWHQQPYPQGIRIQKIYHSWVGGFAIDQNADLWSWGYENTGLGSTGSFWEPVNFNQKWGINDNFVKVFVSDGAWYYTYSIVALTDEGVCYCWGNHRYSNLGVNGDTDLNGTRITGGSDNLTVPVRMSWSETYPVAEVHLTGGYHAGSYWKDTSGNWYSLGEYNTNFQRWYIPDRGSDREIQGVLTELDTNKPVPMSVFQANGNDGAVKQIGHHESDDHSVTGSQYYRLYWVVHANGNLNYFGSSPNQVDWGDTTSGVHTGVNWNKNLINDPIFTNVKRAWLCNGAYVRGIAVKEDGTWWHRGYNGYGLSPTDSSTTSWNQITSAPNNAVKADVYSGQYGTFLIALTSDGKLWCVGQNHGGQRGILNTTDYGGDGTESHLSDVLNQTQNTSPKLGRYPFVNSSQTFVDYFVSGSAGSPGSRFCVYAQDNNGDIWAWGDGYYNMIQSDDGEDRGAPHKLIF